MITRTGMTMAGRDLNKTIVIPKGLKGEDTETTVELEPETFAFTIRIGATETATLYITRAALIKLETEEPPVTWI
jgi:hypothetical protein